MREDVKSELEFIRQRNGGLLKASDVVEYARDNNSALHTMFEWDDSEAAEKYRLMQARSIIRVVVQIIPDTNEKIRTFVSLSSDRVQGNGYRVIADVMEDEQLIDTLLQDAKNELASFSRKYARLQSLDELRPVLNEIDRVINAVQPVNEERASA